MSDYDEIKALLASRRAVASTPRLPRNVQAKLAEKRQNARVVGTCLHCDMELIRTKDNVLRCTLIVQMGGTFSPNCIQGPHVLDPTRTIMFGGRTVRVIGKTGDDE